MTPLAAIQELLSRSLVTVEEGDRCTPRVGKPLSPEEIDAIEAELGAPLPPEIRELMAFARAVEVEFEELNWCNQLGGQDPPNVLPCSVPILLDGCGNSWNVDVNPTTGAWGPVYFLCHDAPVVVWQAASLAEFIIQFADECCQPDREGMLFYVSTEMDQRLWSKSGKIFDAAKARESTDELLRTAVVEAENAVVCDLRQAKPGDGFSLVHFGSRTQIRRCGVEPVWVLSKPAIAKSWWRRWAS